MLNKRTLPLVLLILVVGIVAFRTLRKGENPPTKQEKILHDVGEILEQVHYSPKLINDEFSKKIFSRYLGEVDVEKDVLLQADRCGAGNAKRQVSRPGSMMKYWVMAGLNSSPQWERFIKKVSWRRRNRVL